MITPIPLIKPETTGYGIYLMYFPNFNTPSSTCRIPANINVVIIIGRASVRLPTSETASVINTAATTVIGAVGPLIWVLVPPKSAAKIPRAMAP